MSLGPSSDTLEQFYERLRALVSKLSRLGSKEVTKAELLDEIAAVAREWLQYSHHLRSLPGLDSTRLDFYEGHMSAVLGSTKTRVRASALRRRLGQVVDAFVDEIVIPVIKYEGSPLQVAARQLHAEFIGRVSPEELIYVEEAARCLGQQCHRAAIILLWAAGMARLHLAIQRLGFDAFNRAVQAVNAKKGNPFAKVTKGMVVSSLADLQRARDFDLIVIGMELWGYDLQSFEELERLLGQRNSAAHPGMYQPSALEIQQFAGKLSRFVFGSIRA